MEFNYSYLDMLTETSLEIPSFVPSPTRLLLPDVRSPYCTPRKFLPSTRNTFHPAVSTNTDVNTVSARLNSPRFPSPLVHYTPLPSPGVHSQLVTDFSPLKPDSPLLSTSPDPAILPLPHTTSTSTALPSPDSPATCKSVSSTIPHRFSIDVLLSDPPSTLTAPSSPQLLKSRRGKPMIRYLGFHYNLKKTNKDGSILFVCQLKKKEKCGATLKLAANMKTVLRATGCHCH